MKENIKWVNTRVSHELKTRYDAALKLAKKENNRHIFSNEVIVRSVEAFCEAAEKGKSRDFLKNPRISNGK